MASDPQHCPTCQTEYIAGIAACADCGGPLMPGPLGRYTGAHAGASAAATPTAPAATGAFDALLTQLPGIQADRAVRALLMEEIPCFVECQGLTKTYQPGSPPTEPFAVTLPVTVHVRQADLSTAHEIIDSIDAEDLIGEQWSDEEMAEAAAAGGVPPEDLDGDADGVATATDETDETDRATAPADDPETGAPQAQGTSMVAVVLVVIAVIGLLLFFGRQ